MKILALDGGGSKGIYSLGILHEIESTLGSPLKDHFDCFYGVSTGAIIAAALAQGRSVADLRQLYLENIPEVMSPCSAKKRSARLRQLLQSQFGDLDFSDFTKFVGIVSASYDERLPKIFKTNVSQAHGRKDSFQPGFGAKIWEAVYASCSASPFFEVDTLKCADNSFKLMDGGFAANNPTLFALIDALKAHQCKIEDVRIVNIGTGQFPMRYSANFICSSLRFLPVAKLVPTILDLNSNTLGIVSKMLFGTANIVRLSETFAEPQLKTNFLEHRRSQLELLYQKGKTTFGNCEADFRRVYGLEARMKNLANL